MPDSLKIYCKSPKCRKEIVWMKTIHDKNIPVDWDSLDIEEKKSALIGIPIIYEKLDTFGRPKHIIHFATCADFEYFRKRN